MNDNKTTHVVQPGETVKDIAEKSGTTVEQIAKDNNLEDADHIVPGQELVVTTNDKAQDHNDKAQDNEQKSLPETGTENNGGLLSTLLISGFSLVVGALLFVRKRKSN